MKKEEIKRKVRESYGKVARQENSCCSPVPSCCGSASNLLELSKKIGYTEQELKSIPSASILGLGCGNPVAMASLKEGETVLDLGSGAGVDCFIAAAKVGKAGKVIGVDMTPEMLERARENAMRGGSSNVEFRLGEIENLPIADNFVDVVISNCVINLSPDKPRVFKEAYRVLKPGGRLMVSDIVLLGELPDSIKNSPQAYVACLSGAMLKDNYLSAIKGAGFVDVRVLEESKFPIDCLVSEPSSPTIFTDLGISPEDLENLEKIVRSIKVRAKKPEKD